MYYMSNSVSCYFMKILIRKMIYVFIEKVACNLIN